MSQRKVEFANGEYYHVLNRGVEGRDIFSNEDDYKRFLESLKEFNTTERVKIRDLQKLKNTSEAGGNSTSFAGVLVEILCYCLMPNHFHLLLKQLQENGITKFMHKLGGGYTNYFNLKNERQSPLFQGPFKAVHISNDSQFLHTSRYIHLNVLDLLYPEWREGKLDNWQKAKKFLENYPWSSYPVFIGENSSDFCNPELLKEMIKTPKQYENFIKGWTERSLTEAQDLILE